MTHFLESTSDERVPVVPGSRLAPRGARSAAPSARGPAGLRTSSGRLWTTPDDSRSFKKYLSLLQSGRLGQRGRLCFF